MKQRNRKIEKLFIVAICKMCKNKEIPESKIEICKPHAW